MKEAEAQDGIREVLHRELKKEALTFQKLKGGRNSQVFRVDCADGSRFAAKAYFQSANDLRDRMGNEFRALRFLKAQGLRQVPEAIVADEARHIGIYEFIDGERMPGGNRAEIDQAVDFLRALKGLSQPEKAAHFPSASEACFSVNAIRANLEKRLSRLERAAERHDDLALFLLTDLEPFRKTAEAWSRNFCQENGIDTAAEIAMAERTLSPSDFGFHNALRCADGNLVFLDFEYFGWDDPAKTVCDFLLHPGMTLGVNLRERFHSGALSAFEGGASLEVRVRAVYPLFGLKWCAILLNEFTVEDMERRSFADNTAGAWSGAKQIEKARRLLQGFPQP